MKIALRNSFKRQIVLTFAVGFCCMSSVFVACMVKTESDFLYSDSNERTMALAHSLAVSSRLRLLADDVVGLQEIVNSVSDYPGLRYAMIIAPDGRVLAHTDAGKTGQYLTDAQSRSLIGAAPRNRMMRDESSSIDVAAPVMAGERQIGWARIGRDRNYAVANLGKIIQRGVLYILFSSVLALMAAFLIARRLGHRIGSLVQVTEKVQAGNFDARVNITGRQDEITLLAGRFNRMLDALALNQRELRAAARYTRSLIEASLDPLVTISPEGKITDANKATEEATGRSHPELIGTDFSDYFTEPDKAREGYQQVFDKGFVTNYPLTIRHRDGRITDMLYNASVLRDEAGAVLGAFAAARDITELKRTIAELHVLKNDLENRVKDRTAQLETANQDLESFSYSVSHDLRAPLRAIDGFSLILLEDYHDRLDEEGRRLLNVVRDNTVKMARLIDDILLFSRAGRMQLARVEVDMEALVRSVWAEIAPTLGTRKVSFEVGALPQACGDRSALVQVWTNLLSNAAKFTRPRDPAIIEVGGSADERENIYYVKDNGVGFDMQYSSKLYGVFQRLHGMDEFEGTGIGLAIVKRVITKHGGRVWAEGKPGEGATFWFTLQAGSQSNRASSDLR